MVTNKPKYMLGKAFKGIVATLIILFVACWCYFYPLSDLVGLCRNEITFAATAPDGRYVATVYQRRCGPPSRSAIYVSIRAVPSRFKATPNDSILVIDWTLPIGLFWTDNSHLVVQSIGWPADHVVRQEKVWHDVSVSYESYGKIMTDNR